MADEGEVFPYYKVYFKLGDYNSYNLILLRFPYYKVYFKPEETRQFIQNEI